MQDEFFIGWQKKAPPSYARAMRKTVILLGLGTLLLALALPLAQRPFDDSTFEFGQATQLEGTLVKYPALMLRLDFGPAGGAPVYRHILLTGFGKNGANATIAAWERGLKGSLEGKRVRLSGELIYYDGQTLLEVSEDKMPEILPNLKGTAEPEWKNVGQATLRGEILDPKCAFGVMKPGYGKPHRSCAVRCISGGIPPVFRVQSPGGETRYYLLAGPHDDPIIPDILPYIADQVELHGSVQQWGDWPVLRLELGSPALVRLAPWWMDGKGGELCGSAGH